MSYTLRIKCLDRLARHRAFRRRGRGSWSYDKPALLIMVGICGDEDYDPSSNVEVEGPLK